MNVCVVGLWHLGTVTAACLADAGHKVTGLDFDPAVVTALNRGRPPVHEPGLDELVTAGLAAQQLCFTTDVEHAVANVDVVWFTDDTPVSEDDRADVEWVAGRIGRVLPHLTDGTLVLVSSQLPVGTTRRLERQWAVQSRGRRVSFGCIPENLRLGDAIRAFTRQDRAVVGLRDAADRARVGPLLSSFTGRVEWMSVESAEMTKHALNAFLAASVAFINEVASLCEQVGADAVDVARGLTSDVRIGPKAYVSPGAAFAGGTLARDIVFLSSLGAETHVPVHVLSAVKVSNDAHRLWAQRRLAQSLEPLAGRSVAVWGLTYKPGTDTLRRSSAIELCRWLVGQGATVRVHDPVVRELPEDLRGVVALAASPAEAVRGSSALVVATPWPEYRNVAAADVIPFMKRPLVLDASRFTSQTLGLCADVEYLSVGRASA